MNYSKSIFLILLMISCQLFSQTTGSRNVAVALPVVTLMDIEPSGTISLNYTAPTEAGNAITAPIANTSKWINYTSAIAPSGLSRRITASVNQTIPGIDIKIQAATASGSGGGTLGIPSAQITLTTVAQTVISGIGGAFTGNGSNNGHQLTVTLVTNNYSSLNARSNTPVIITYTITE
ncbi:MULTISPECIES: hypothetical protein [Chryseobacterium]|uniref:Uncharacterized protein n=1 Tax=Chryseobacterium gambrini TaxID=373672 RepID=A0A1N7QWK3_9FLAO|nr:MULTISPECIES: hypothetical protein [Chryseobacterium]MCY1663637.1 hypothetical protein [Chryseobacterium sp. SL1]SIT27174.1 hypothetical protein SAMN05421785_12054 [Chryseobacterium gambrini]